MTALFLLGAQRLFGTEEYFKFQLLAPGYGFLLHAFVHAFFRDSPAQAAVSPDLKTSGSSRTGVDTQICPYLPFSYHLKCLR